ncbi:MAG: energy transducer TonB [Telluria sp.]
MRVYLCLLGLLAPAVALAGNSYSPKFAREDQPGSILFDLCSKPEYPKSSLRNEEQGTVALRFTIAPTGRLLKLELARSSGFRELDRAAQNALSQCRFRPTSIKGQPVQSPVDVQYVWTIQ